MASEDADDLAEERLSSATKFDLQGRRNLAKAIAQDEVRQALGDEYADCIYGMACDPSWQVRLDLAYQLLHLPYDIALKAIAILSRDDHATVSRTAINAAKRLQKSQTAQRRDQQGLDYLNAEIEKFRKIYGDTATDRLLRMVEALFEFEVGAIVHEIRPRISSIRHATHRVGQIMDQVPLDQSRLRTAAHQVEDRMAGLAALFEDLRNYTRTLPEDVQPELLAPILSSAYEEAREALRSRDLDISRIQYQQQCSETITVPATRKPLVMAFENLLRNAMEALLDYPPTQGFPKVRVRVESNGQEVIASIEDNGPGQEADQIVLMNTFRPCHSHKKHGTGIGLMIANRCIRKHLGRMVIDASPMGGLRVTCHLPLRHTTDRSNEYIIPGT